VREGDGPSEFHLVLLDGGRSDVLADEVGRQALHCIRCSACLNVCPVYERVGGQAYESVYPGPIGAILTPLLKGLDEAPSLPWASSLCGACYEVCPVKIDIPSVLVHLRGRVVREEKSRMAPEALAMKGMAAAFATRRRYEAAQRLARLGRGPLAKAAIPGWSAMRDLPVPPKETFRDWWQHREPRPAPPRDEVVGGDVDGAGASPRPSGATSPRPPDATSPRPPDATSPPPETGA
jgi:L-lactate dehydrogenase complex protein LldF